MRFERMTYRLEGGCSIQLSYQGLIFFFNKNRGSKQTFGFLGFLYIPSVTYAIIKIFDCNILFLLIIKVCKRFLKVDLNYSSVKKFCSGY